MKRVLVWMLSVCLLFSLCGCLGSIKEKEDITDYQYMYDGIVKVWNKTMMPKENRDNLFGFGEYLYNSYLVLFPRKTPSSLTDYYFYWQELIDYDDWGIYFTCQPNQENYRAFVKGLEEFRVTDGGSSIALLYDDTHFSLPVYLLQWRKISSASIYEFIMLDEEKHTVVFVYTMDALEEIEKNSSYTVTPSELDFLTEDFTIYDDFESCTYDISFLDYLN